jgi:S4 domain protein YaaA
MKDFKINSEYITLGKLLKAEAHIGSGGEAKFFLWQNDIFVNDERRTERGKKLYHGDIIKVDQDTYRIVYDPKD